ncbi:hypothetical protein FQR65_LT17415 [Abscondita terminalis]|nr:hypothetical protein FQR65_LT17415 [Abscondita terminalis]
MANISKPARARKTTRYIQYELYLEEVEVNQAFRDNKFDGSNPNLLSESWKKLTNKLNAVGGAIHTTAGWKRVFTDWKSQVRAKARKFRTCNKETGNNGDLIKPLNDLEEKLLDITGRVVVSGMPSVPEVGIRIFKLRLKYDCVKRSIKQKQAANKLETFKTGRGISKVTTLTDYEEKLLSYICVSVEGLLSEKDSDIIIPETMECSNIETQEDNVITEFIVDADNTCQLLTNAVDHDYYKKNIIVTEERQSSSSISCNENTATENWKSWNPKQLKQKKTCSIISTTPKKVNKETLNNKIDVLAETRKQYLENQEQRQLDVHKLLMENLKIQQQILLDFKERQIEEGNLKRQLLLLEIENKKLELRLKKNNNFKTF